MNDEPTTVTYTVKELLARLDNKIDGLIEMLATKAEQAELNSLTQRVSHLETEQAEILAIAVYKRWLIGLSVSVLGVGVALVALLVR